MNLQQKISVTGYTTNTLNYIINNPLHGPLQEQIITEKRKIIQSFLKVLSLKIPRSRFLKSYLLLCPPCKRDVRGVNCRCWEICDCFMGYLTFLFNNILFVNKAVVIHWPFGMENGSHWVATYKSRGSGEIFGDLLMCLEIKFLKHSAQNNNQSVLTL